MPNKDSFTFSDKLKKSKSLPLSKRIPSKVGGDGKAKRTLIQRAQRDLPFIIVAAAALLLLPVLSRDGAQGVDTTPGIEDLFPTPSGSDMPGGSGLPLPDDITPNGFRNPLDMIVRPISGEDTPAEPILPYDFDGDDGPRNAPYVAPEPVTGTYGAPAQRAVRAAAAPRQPTAISALRTRNRDSVGGSSGAGRTLLVGGPPTDSSGTGAPRTGVRPVALQPLQSAGRGGRGGFEDGYAEAARSAMAMNAGPAKQAIMAAQLGPVDGTPLGAAAHAPGQGGRTGAGGAPSNNMAYQPQLPWWWDLQKDRMQKNWELWNYNWNKALSDNLIKAATGVFNCLLTGNSGGDVKNFLGTPAGDNEFVCVDASGKQVGGSTLNEYMKLYQFEQGSGDSATSQGIGGDPTAAYMKYICEPAGGVKLGPSPDSYKGWLRTRFRCLGLRKGKGLFKAPGLDEKNSCVYADALNVEFVASKRADTLAEHRIGYYVVANRFEGGKKGAAKIIFLDKGAKSNAGDISKRLAQLNAEKEGVEYRVSNIVGFIAAERLRAEGSGVGGGAPQTPSEVLMDLVRTDTRSDMDGNSDTDAELNRTKMGNFVDNVGDFFHEIADGVDNLTTRDLDFASYRTAIGGDSEDSSPLTADEVKKWFEWAKNNPTNNQTKRKEAVQLARMLKAAERQSSGSGAKRCHDLKSCMNIINTAKDEEAVPDESTLAKYLDFGNKRTPKKACPVDADTRATFGDMCHKDTASGAIAAGCEPIQCANGAFTVDDVTTTIPAGNGQAFRNFGAVIMNPGDCVFAVQVEMSERAYEVKHTQSFIVEKDASGKPEPSSFYTCEYKSAVAATDTTVAKPGGYECTFRMPEVMVAHDLEGAGSNGSEGEVKAEQPGGTGKVYWITDNSKCADLQKTWEKGVRKANESEILELLAAKKHGVCFYKWNCPPNTTCGAAPAAPQEYCSKKGEGDALTYHKVTAAGPSEEPVTGDEITATGQKLEDIQPCKEVPPDTSNPNEGQGESNRGQGEDITVGNAMCHARLSAVFDNDQTAQGRMFNRYTASSAGSRNWQDSAGNYTIAGDYAYDSTITKPTNAPSIGEALLQCIRDKKSSLTLKVSGHASYDKETTAARNHNVDLSQGRARTVTPMLVAQLKQDLSDAAHRVEFADSIERIGFLDEDLSRYDFGARVSVLPARTTMDNDKCAPLTGLNIAEAQKPINSVIQRADVVRMVNKVLDRCNIDIDTAKASIKTTIESYVDPDPGFATVRPSSGVFAGGECKGLDDALVLIGDIYQLAQLTHQRLQLQVFYCGDKVGVNGGDTERAAENQRIEVAVETYPDANRRFASYVPTNTDEFCKGDECKAEEIAAAAAAEAERLAAEKANNQQDSE